MKKKILTVFLALTMLVGVFAASPLSTGATAPEAWDGSVDTDFEKDGSVYLISSAAELAGMSKLITTDKNGDYNKASYRLTADIVLNDFGEFGHVSEWYDNWYNDNTGTGEGVTYPVLTPFTPIGKWETATSSFGGTFDGDGHTISGLYIYADTADNQGLFGAIHGGATIKNFALVNSLVGAENGCVGAVVGTTDRQNEGAILIENIYVDAYVYSGGTAVGGIVGNLAHTKDGYDPGVVTMKNVTFTGSVEGANYVAGLIGDSRNVVFDIDDCLVYANVKATNGQYAAGFVVRSNPDSSIDLLEGAHVQVITNSILAGGSITAYKANKTSYNRAYISSSSATNKPLVETCYNAIADLSPVRYADTAEELDPPKPSADTRLAELYGSYEGETTVVWTNLTNWARPDNDIARPKGIAEDFDIFPKTEFTVTWKNEDGTVLATETYETGATPSYKGEAPTKAEDDKYTYEFMGWTPELTDVTEDATYTAEFLKKRKGSGDENEATDDFEPTDTASTASEEAETEAEKSGCGSIIGGGAVALVTIVGLGALGLKKKED